MFNLVIDRNIWPRGEGGQRSRLLRRKDGKMCCIGQCLEQMGVLRPTLEGTTTASSLGDDPLVPNWMRALNKDTDYEDISILYETNDNRTINDSEREQYLTKVFARQNITVEFIN